MRGRRKLRTGVVMSDKMQKTVTVSLVRRLAHGFYGKQVVRTKQVAAHDELGAKAGDTVRIMESRPVSKTKRWRVVAIVERARGGEGTTVIQQESIVKIACKSGARTAQVVRVRGGSKGRTVEAGGAVRVMR